MNPFLRTQAFSGGEWIGAASGATFPVTNPATGEILAEVPDLGAFETEAAITHAAAAQALWAARPAKERGAILKRWADLMMAHQADLAELLTLEQGKPLAEAKGEVAYAASFLEWFGEEARRASGEVIPSPRSDSRILVIKQPVGVVATVTPWNFPYAMLTRKVGPALAAGCTVIAKPAEDTPLCALALADLGVQAGVPAGVFNVLTGDAATIVGALMRSETVRKISFTGSTEVGKLLLRQAADTVKRVSLELGGNAPFIVFDDADVDAAVTGAMASKFRNSGQTCVCANRFYVQDGVYDAFTEKFTAAIEALKVAPGLEAGATQGPLISQAAVEKVEDHIADALAKGAVLKTGGSRHALGGTFFQPTLLTETPASAKLAHEETFGPVAALFRFKTEDEAIARANASESGLAAYVYTRDLGRAFRVGEALQVGMVGLNEGIISTAEAPFGGVKQSGLGREGARVGLDEYLEIKYMLVGGLGR
jgi:succinate-semialdehyde dehydrogenase/glutarate-semialdehyde dehydrogenase